MLHRTPPTIVLRGPVNVACHRHHKEWFATALEFDLVGYGNDKKAAIKMLQELVSEYLHEVASLLRDGKQVKFFNPSEPDQWNQDSVDLYNVTFTLPSPKVAQKQPADGQSISRLIEYINSLEDVALSDVSVRMVAA